MSKVVAKTTHDVANDVNDNDGSVEKIEEKVFLRGNEKVLEFRNVSYEQEGHWVCVASNIIKGKERRVQSPALTLEVTGRPQVLLTNASRIQEFVTGTDGVVKAVFCSDPKYRKIFWEWGGLNLTEGDSYGRFFVSDSIPDPGRSDCYLSRLRISEIGSSDSRVYFLNVVNERGQTKQGIEVKVMDTVAMSTMIGVTLSVLLLAAVFLIFSVYAYKTRTACFGFRKSVFGDEADTQNFRINYPSELIISPPISRPETVPDHEDSEDRDDSEIGYLPSQSRAFFHEDRPGSPIPPPIPTTTTTTSSTSYSKNGGNNNNNGNRNKNVSMKRRAWAPSYPLPPNSQFSVTPRTSTFRPKVGQKTPQNNDGRCLSSSLASSTSTLSNVEQGPILQNCFGCY